ncbi:hypothetical protein Poli38472_010789 [Pythium oligandrum]|uniref:Uncharacterized protein n=1 Tax=Pythium oligandrum TaxID=41045 RepID=A0A8K1FGJ7_PYTOL|nr:hypothetical protein Poli38472_010789 [Pythium oligandrum]|eukprot:TMW61726.1 hypothetical protein Poli38472_010789 [Pythium oligandrum]
MVFSTRSLFSASGLVALLALAQQPAHVDAHGHLIEPKADFGANKKMMSSFAGRIPEPNVIFEGSSFPESGTRQNYKEFMKYYKAGALRDIIKKNNKPLDGATADCGFSVVGAAQKLPSTVLWGKNEGTADSEGFRPSHLGACESYCDDQLVQQADECAVAYNVPDNKGSAQMKLTNPEKCTGAKQFTFYWLTTQARDEGGFQVYVNCIGLDGSGASAGGAPSNSTTTVAPTKVPAGSDADDETPGSVAPSPATDDDEYDNETTAPVAPSNGTDTTKTKKPKKTKAPKTKKPKKTKAPKASSDDSVGGDADDGVDC